MTSRQIERILWGLTAICVTVTGVAMVHAHPISSSVVSPAMVTSHVAEMYDQTTLDDAADSVVANDPFRTERRPARVAFGMLSAPPPTAPPSSRPQLSVSGVIGGPPWRAVVNGVPGHEGGVVVAQGDTVSGLRIRRVRRDTVIVQGPDTTWTILMRH